MSGLLPLALVTLSALGCLVLVGARRRPLRRRDIAGLVICATMLAVVLVGTFGLTAPDSGPQDGVHLPTVGQEPVTALTEPPIPRR